MTVHYYLKNGEKLVKNGNALVGKGLRVPIRKNIPRFTPDESYSTGNFSRLREEHATLQLDSRNGTSDRLNTILNRTGWPKEFFKDKLILECGCGAGPDTEALLDLGAKVVAVDIAGVDIAQKNLASHPKFKNVQFVQDSISNLHFKPKTFDIVFCHRVLQHTPNPPATLEHILKFVKEDGHVFVHSYSNSHYQMWRWKYALLPLTRKIPPRALYGFIKAYSWPAFYITNVLNKFRPGAWFAHVFIPFYNYRGSKKFKQKTNKFIVEYGVHDTFDALSPPYDKPIKPEVMEAIAKRYIGRKFEIYKDSGMTLLRTKP